MTTTIGRLRVIAFVEGCSYVVLLGIAMPLKYFAGLPVAVKVAGSIHGALFVVFCAALMQAMIAARWSLGRAAIVFVASVVPLGTFVLDPHLRRWGEADRPD